MVRPLVERAGTIHYLREHPEALAAWRSGWPRRSQPSLDALLALLHPAVSSDTHESLRTMMHKLVHSDPAGSVYNMFRRKDGALVFPSGKVIDQPNACDFLSIAGRHYLERLIAIAVEIFPPSTPASSS